MAYFFLNLMFIKFLITMIEIKRSTLHLQCRFKTLLDSQISVPVSSQERYGIEINQSQGFARQLKCINCRRCKISTWVEIGFGFVLHCWHSQRIYLSLCYKSLSFNIFDGKEYHQYFITINILQPAGALQLHLNLRLFPN